MTEDAQTEAECRVQTADLCTLPPKHQNIILIGMPAVGKTTIGKRIAAAADLTFLDTDRIIEAETGKKIPDLLKENGTDGFLAIENRVCAALHVQNSIIATGGSVVYGEDAMRNLSEYGTVVYLKLAYPLLQKRLHAPRERGVVLRRGQSLYDLYRERVPLYEKYADIIIDEHTCYPTQTAERVYRALRRNGFFRERKNIGYLPRTLFSKKSEEQKNAAKIQDK